MRCDRHIFAPTESLASRCFHLHQIRGVTRMLLHVAPLPADSNIVQPSVLSVGGSKAKYRYFRVHDGFKSVRKRPDCEAERGRYCELLLARSARHCVRYKMFVLLEGAVQ